MKYYGNLLNHYHLMIRWIEKEQSELHLRDSPQKTKDSIREMYEDSIRQFRLDIGGLIEEAQRRMHNRPTWKKLLRIV